MKFFDDIDLKRAEKDIEVLTRYGLYYYINLFGKKKEEYHRKWMRKFERKARTEGCRIESGASKIVMIFDHEDFVIKVPYGDFNFCDIEAKNYEAAYDCDLESVFAKTEYTGIVHCALKFYLQENIEVDADENCYLISDSSYSAFDSEDDDYIIQECLAYNGEPSGFIDSVVNFCDERKINDLHSSNWGIKDGKMVLIDFSGYY